MLSLVLLVVAGCGGSDGGGEPDPLVCAVPGEIREGMLRRVNEARAAGGRCGAERFGPSAPLRWNDTLAAVAAGHARDMAANNFFDHTGSDGLSPGERAEAAGYDWGALGENLAAGIEGVDSVFVRWMASPEHCREVLDPRFREMGVACAADAGSDYQVYWVQMLGTRR